MPCVRKEELAEEGSFQGDRKMKSLGITKKKFLIYMFAAFGLGWILQIIASPFFHVNMTVFTSIMVLAMFMPFLGILIARIPFKGMGWIPHLKGRIRYVLFSLYMPLLLSIIGAVLYFAIFPDTIDLEFSGMRLQLEQAGTLELLEAQGLTMPMYVMIGVIASVTYGPFINMFAALGEEVGWRGAMYPYLKDMLLRPFLQSHSLFKVNIYYHCFLSAFRSHCLFPSE